MTLPSCVPCGPALTDGSSRAPQLCMSCLKKKWGVLARPLLTDLPVTEARSDAPLTDVPPMTVFATHDTYFVGIESCP